jgi:hypothetical protein
VYSTPTVLSSPGQRYGSCSRLLSLSAGQLVRSISLWSLSKQSSRILSGSICPVASAHRKAHRLASGLSRVCTACLWRHDCGSNTFATVFWLSV